LDTGIPTIGTAAGASFRAGRVIDSQATAEFVSSVAIGVTLDLLTPVAMVGAAVFGLGYVANKAIGGMLDFLDSL
jgi:hypothetical protein